MPNYTFDLTPEEGEVWRANNFSVKRVIRTLLNMKTYDEGYKDGYNAGYNDGSPRGAMNPEEYD
jgi:hypothetical protein